jgi:hypothetical protein
MTASHSDSLTSNYCCAIPFNGMSSSTPTLLRKVMEPAQIGHKNVSVAAHGTCSTTLKKRCGPCQMS